MTRLSSSFFFSLCYLVIAAISYHGVLSPYLLGLIDAFSVAALLIAIVLIANRFSNITYFITHTALIGVFAFTTFSSWVYFDFFQSLYSREVFAMGADMGAGIKGITFEPYGLTVVTVTAICSLLTLIGIRQQQKHKGRKTASIWAALIITIAGVAGLSVVELSLASYESRAVKVLHPANITQLHALLRPGTQNNYSENELDEAYSFYQDFHQKENLNERKAIPSEKVQDPQKLNLIIVLLESFRADFVGIYNQKSPSITPNFDAIANENAFAKKYYSNATHTISAELGIWCGLFDKIGASKMSYHTDKLADVRCLPHMLGDRGYQTTYYHGNTATFYSRDLFIPRMGFAQGYFHEDQPDNELVGHNIGWGLDDVTMFSIMLDQLLEKPSSQPFFAHVTTISNHYPFHWELPIEKGILPYGDAPEENLLTDNYKNAVFYTDYALGKFWERFKASELAENTVVIITSDHGIWNFDERRSFSLLEKTEKYHRAPLAIYHPDWSQAKIIDEVASHIDMLPTIQSLLKIDEQGQDLLGTNIFDKTGNRKSWAIMNKGIDYVLRINDDICYLDIDQCATKHQDCMGWRGDVVLDEVSQPFLRCQRIEGDVFAKYTASDSEPLINEFAKAKIAVEKSRLKAQK